MKKYYKYIIGAVVIIGLVICFKSCIDKKESDVVIAYIGNDFVNRELFEENISLITDECTDITGDGEFTVELMEISFNEALGYADKSNSDKKLANAIGMGTARLYIMDKNHVLSDKEDGVFADVSHLGEGIRNSAGQTIAISLKGNANLKKIGIDSNEDLYLAIRIVSEVDKAMDKNIAKKDEAVRNMAEAILS